MKDGRRSGGLDFGREFETSRATWEVAGDLVVKAARGTRRLAATFRDAPISPAGSRIRLRRAGTAGTGRTAETLLSQPFQEGGSSFAIRQSGEKRREKKSPSRGGTTPPLTTDEDESGCEPPRVASGRTGCVDGERAFGRGPCTSRLYCDRHPQVGRSSLDQAVLKTVLDRREHREKEDAGGGHSTRGLTSDERGLPCRNFWLLILFRFSRGKKKNVRSGHF